MTPSLGRTAAGSEEFDHRPCSRDRLTFGYLRRRLASTGTRWTAQTRRFLHLRTSDGGFSVTALLLSDQCPYETRLLDFQGDAKSSPMTPTVLRGSVVRQLDDCLSDLEDDDAGNRWPSQALRETLVNALLHRDYSFSGPTLVNRFATRMEVVSLGGLVTGLETNDLLNGVCQPRNPWLADAFELLGMSENAGLGVQRIMEAYESSGVSPQLRVAPASVAMVLPLPVRDDVAFSGSSQAASSMDSDGRRTALRYAFPLGKSIGSDSASALAGMRVIGCAPLLSVMLSPTTLNALRNTLDAPDTTEVRTLEEITLHLFARKGVELTRAEVQRRLGLSRNQAAHLLRMLTRQGRLSMHGRSRATRYSLP
ncbi:ATP-binding protein [uncultured Bifidobacterium sp.]|uniref:ATP-binding protein n=1 Tax=uncultured Bifidobacterium sp. TaxID=165187 RepID=UPI0028DB5D0B|nr:ATP-binding protein [uncultured Bifidobacterium sp.]